MSNIYIQEPPTFGKVLLNTTVGDIEIELWSKEAPKACRNFVQLNMEGYYDETIFHRLVKEFIVQGGDPKGTGEGGESIYGKPFKDELHSRLRFVRRGLVAMANSGPNDNGSQFFFTLATTPELMNKHTIFGKVVGDTLYNMLKLSEGEVDRDEKPVYPHKINSSKVLTNPFEDIVPRLVRKKERSGEAKKLKSRSKATKNFKLLSFGEEAEEEEQEAIEAADNLRHKAKSSHDLLNDAKLSSLPAVEGSVALSEDVESEKRQASEEDEEGDESEAVKQRIKKKFKVSGPVKEKSELTSLKEPGEKSKKSLEELRDEVRALKKDLTEAKKRKEKRNEEDKTQKEPSPAPEDIVIPEDDPMAAFHAQQEKYKQQKGKKAKGKGSKREAATLDMLHKFKTRLSAAQRLSAYEDDDNAEEGEEAEEEEDANDMSWMSHKLEFDEKNRKVLDANMADSERYEIFDPRNPINVRRRGEDKPNKQTKHK